MDRTRTHERSRRRTIDSWTVQSAYAPGSLRNKLIGRGDRLTDEHRGASYRVGGRGATIIERPSTMPSSSGSDAAQPSNCR